MAALFLAAAVIVQRQRQKNVCVCVGQVWVRVCVRLWCPCGASVTAGWSHLTNHDIMVSTGPFPPLLTLSSALPLSIHLFLLVLNFPSPQGKTSNVCKLKIFYISIFSFLFNYFFFLLSFFQLRFCNQVVWPKWEMFPINRRNKKQQNERPAEKELKEGWRDQGTNGLVSFAAWHNTTQRPTHSKQGNSTCPHSSQAQHINTQLLRPV